MFRKWFKGADSEDRKSTTDSRFEAQLIESLRVHPCVFFPGFIEANERDALQYSIKIAKVGLSDKGIADIYEEGLGDRFLQALMDSSRSVVPVNQNELVARAEHLENNYGIGKGFYRLWLNLSPLEREVRRVLSELPLMSAIQKLTEGGLPMRQATTQLLQDTHMFVWYSDDVESIGRTDTDAPFHMELFPIINQILESIGFAEENNVAMMMAQECRDYPSANAWIRHRILKTITEEDIEQDHPSSYIRF